MMKLFIDTTDNKKTVVGLDKKTWQVATKKHQSQQLLGLINKILQGKRNSINQITEIEVNLGPGSFTGLRVGVSVANALGWALKIPINGQRVGKLVEPKYE
jgi:tRNA threonylcarbamoyl adenosine modification protein YeaZ